MTRPTTVVQESAATTGERGGGLTSRRTVAQESAATAGERGAAVTRHRTVAPENATTAGERGGRIPPLFAAYLAERFHPAVFVPAIALHAVLALWAAEAEPTAARLAAAAGLVAPLLLQFRLWDDLEDRDRDRAAHPERVLVAAPPAPFRRALLAIGLGNLIVIAAAPAAATLSAAAPAALAVLDVVFFAAYRLRARVSDRFWRFGVLLSKYPAFIGIVAMAAGAARAPRLALAMAAMYAAANGYEALHDRHSRGEHGHELDHARHRRAGRCAAPPARRGRPRG